MTRAATATGFGWSDDLVEEFEGAWENGRVGHRLLSQTDQVRVWHLSLDPGARIGFHRHVLDYFWTAVTPGRSRSHMQDGSISTTDYAVGTTKHYRFGPGEFMIHDLENIGDTVLAFVTVEHLDSANAPLLLAPDILAGSHAE